jgi:hypothetical protein
MALSEGFAAASRGHGGEGGGDMDAGAERLSVAPLRLVWIEGLSPRTLSARYLPQRWVQGSVVSKVRSTAVLLVQSSVA